MLQLVQAFTALDNHELRRSLVESIERIAKRNKRTEHQPGSTYRSHTRVIAGLSGFFTLRQVFVQPER